MKILSYIKISLRSLFLHRGFSLITLLGLSVGIAMSIFVLEYVFYQFSYDEHYVDSEDIYRVVSEGQLGGEDVHVALSPMPLARVLNHYREADAVTRVVDASGKPVQSDFSRSYENDIIYADSSFFRVFQRPFLAGDPGECLVDSSCIAISASAAERLFGDRDPMGKKVQIEDEHSYEVHAVYQDVPKNSHFQYDFVLPFRSVERKLQERYGDEYKEIDESWFSLITYIYFKHDGQGGSRSFQDRLNSDVAPDMNAEAEELFDQQTGAELHFKFQSIENIYLFSDYEFEIGETTHSLYVFVFLGVALFILMITVFNFMNLTTARALDRAREAGVRRMFGAARRHLVVQFISESVLFSLVALFLGLVMVELLSPVFSRLFGMELFEAGVRQNFDFLWILGITLFVGFSSGIYPAFVFSGIRGVHLQKGYHKFSSRPGLWVRGALVLIQVFVAVTLMATAIGMQRQLRFVNEAELGYEPSEMLLVERAHYLDNKAGDVTGQIKDLDGVRNVSQLFHTPGDPVSVMSFHFSENRDRMFMLSVYPVDCSFFETIQSEIPTGDFHCKDSSSVVVNRHAASLFGGEGVVGQNLHTITRQPEKMIDLKITGVAKNIHHGGLKQSLRPALYVPAEEGSTPSNILVRYREGKRREVVEQMKEIWNQAGTEAPFAVTDMEDKLDSFYQEDRRYGSLATAFALLTVVIASLGMTGLVSFLLATHQQDMLLRKINGLPDAGNLIDRFKSYFFFVFFGVLMALPLSQFLLRRWTDTFSVQFPADYLCFIAPAVFLLVIAVLIAAFSGKRILSRMSLHHF
ncbi:MAG: ABC transporter permease [Bacteroidota bacterium]